jgi:hypothetical protein
MAADSLDRPVATKLVPQGQQQQKTVPGKSPACFAVAVKIAAS